ncbi:MAG: tetratricopeptide repeat protein [Candidatus Sericytochromatia bacterium]
MFIVNEVAKKKEIINKIFKPLENFSVNEITRDLKDSDLKKVSDNLIKKHYRILVRINASFETLLSSDSEKDILKEYELENLVVIGKHIEELIFNLDSNSEDFERKLEIINFQIKDYLNVINRILLIKNFVEDILPNDIKIEKSYEKHEFIFELNKNNDSFNSFYLRLSCIKNLYDTLLKINNIQELEENSLKISYIEKGKHDLYQLYGLKDIFSQTISIILDYIYIFNSKDIKFDPIENKIKETADKNKINPDNLKKFTDSIKRALRNIEFEYCSKISIDKLVFEIKYQEKSSEKRKKLTETMNSNKSQEEAIEALKEYMEKTTSPNSKFNVENHTKKEQKELEVIKAQLLAKSRNINTEDIKNSQSELSRGITLMALRRYTEALDNFNRATSLNPTYAEAYNNKSLSYIQLGNYMEAIKEANNALAIKENYTEAYLNKGMALFSMGRHAEAVSQYKKAIESDRKCFDAYYNIGNCLMLLNRKGEAIKSFTKSLEINSDYAPAYYNRACAYLSEKDTEKCLDDLETAVKFDISFKEMIKNDSDFRELKALERFKDIVA